MRETEPSAQLFAASLPDGIVVVDSFHNVLWYNENAGSILSFDANKTINLLNVFESDFIKRLFSLPKSDTLELVSPFDENTYLSLCVRPFYQGQFILVIKNITHRRHLEAIRHDFVANVSHELRTPLTVFHGYLELLLSNSAISADKLREILLQMSGQAGRMERLVEDLLLLAKLESVEPDLTRYTQQSVSVVIKDVLRDAESLSEGRHTIVTRVPDSLLLFADPQELRSAVSNLVFNAVRYTPSGGEIVISAYHVENTLVIEVRDNGIGIAEKHISRITQRFYRVDKSRTYRGQGGTGLGLAIVKHVALRHGAEVKIESEKDRGSVFRLIFPQQSIVSE